MAPFENRPFRSVMLMYFFGFMAQDGGLLAPLALALVLLMYPGMPLFIMYVFGIIFGAGLAGVQSMVFAIGVVIEASGFTARPDEPFRVVKHNFFGDMSSYVLDYHRYSANRRIDSLNNHITNAWVAVTNGNQGLVVAQQTAEASSFAIALFPFDGPSPPDDLRRRAELYAAAPLALA